MISGKDKSLQNSFDVGYYIGFRSAFERGKYRHFFNTLDAIQSHSPPSENDNNTKETASVKEELRQELKVFKKWLMPLPPVELKPTEFERVDRRNSLQTLSTMAEKSFTELDEKCSEQLPKTFALLNIPSNSENNDEHTLNIL